jgi:hypothetical protein
MRAGVPTVMYPLLFDTQDTARRAARAGASLTLPMPQLSAPALAAALRRLLAEPAFTHAAARLRDVVLAEGARTRTQRAQHTCEHDVLTCFCRLFATLFYRRRRGVRCGGDSAPGGAQPAAGVRAAWAIA